jgi:hypothetical protein
LVVVVLEARAILHQAAMVRHHHSIQHRAQAVAVVVHTTTVQVKTVVLVAVVLVRTVQLRLEQEFQAKVLRVE